ncbi:type VII secretion target [Actinoplanes sp. NPDC049599]|uniref:type VII secretion target n=1 Tax=Actinoplanes sp. NPDC049599 TaxID=3363903 RepID=UPI00379F2801
MTDGFSADPAQLRRHAAHLEAVRARFGAVRSASAAIAGDGSAYGLLCGWLPAVLEGRHQRQDSLLSYVEENLTLAAEALTEVADAYDEADAGAADTVHRAGRRRAP